jgi:hypothetical protein
MAITAFTLPACTSLLGDYAISESSAREDAGSGGDATVRDDGSTKIDAALDGSSRDSAVDAEPPDSSTEPCVAESDVALCTKAGKDCGGIIAKDSCGSSRAIPSCGTCALPKTCGAQKDNQCGCSAETDAEFCARFGKNCGAFGGIDNCNAMRGVSTCGTCSIMGEKCGASVPNVCGPPVCIPESDARFCKRYGRNCGPLAEVDNCNGRREVADCGVCVAPQTCGVESKGVCGCIPESDASLCARVGRTCGVLEAIDNCGAKRYVQDCGTCTGASNICGMGGTCTCNGNPACAGGLACCKTGCVDTNSNPANCGKCGGDCGPGGGWACALAKCQCGATKTMPTSLCSDGVTCVPIHTDFNCTSCGDFCGRGATCCAQSRLLYSCTSSPLCGVSIP